MGRGKLTLYSLVLQPPPLFTYYYQAIRPVISPRSLVTKCTTFFSEWGIWELHPPWTFNEGLTTTLLGDWVAIQGNKGDLTELENSINSNTQPEPHCCSASRQHFPSQLHHSLTPSFNLAHIP
ncbi:hypothetical protein O181_111097 [Austropuccinia psidii MF-1]|uniref:Uncharacterized protein n=1 Tax=Austropuccinia psidii MF-1 TaxID=1389203 RepID=A0A9Q3K147_9BASI|nr:hypothetical protein [Austropuccinia psidii MF-1]